MLTRVDSDRPRGDRRATLREEGLPRDGAEGLHGLGRSLDRVLKGVSSRACVGLSAGKHASTTGRAREGHGGGDRARGGRLPESLPPANSRAREREAPDRPTNQRARDYSIGKSAGGRAIAFFCCCCCCCQAGKREAAAGGSRVRERPPAPPPDSTPRSIRAILPPSPSTLHSLLAQRQKTQSRVSYNPL